MLSTIGRALNLSQRSGGDGLKDDIEKLDRKLRMTQATIEEVEHRDIDDVAINLWLQELKGVASDAEDILDEYYYEILQCQLEVKLAVTTNLSGQDSAMESTKAVINHVSSFFLENTSLEMIKKIRQINSRFDEIARDREALRLTNEEGERRGGAVSCIKPLTSHLMNKDDTFGRNDEKDKIIELLLSGVQWNFKRKDQLKVIAISGMGGIGKTTLAQMVYNDLSNQSIFDVMAWVYVSPEFDIIRLTKEISEFVTGKPGSSFDGFSKIQEELQKEIVGKKLFLVLDDVWTVQQNDWEMLFLPLRVAKLVRVLVTSRNDVAAQVPYTVYPYKLHVLPENECLELLYHCAFGWKEMRETEWSLDIGRQIIKKCGGLPLAVKCIGKVLHYSEDQYSWREILDSELWQSDELDPIFRALKLSYYHLPLKLRDCFLFCSLFPKGSQLRKISIIYMWMAHGFLRPKERERPEDIGENYLAELQMRSFFEPCTKGSFRLHDVIHDLARSISGGEIHSIMDEKSSRLAGTIRHLYIQKGNNSCQSFRPQRLRTLFNATLGTHDIMSVRVLGLIGPNVLALAHSPLKHLRYLGIREFNGETLPESLCLLHHLQTLEISHCYHLRYLPTNISNLENLRYLHITYVGIEELPVMLWQVHNLRRLSLRECNNFRVLPLGISNLKNLHVLQLKSCQKLEELPADIGNLINLSVLDLSFSGIRTFPESIGLLKLTRLVLIGVTSVMRPGIVRKQPNSNPVLRRVNVFNRLSSEDEQTSIVEPEVNAVRNSSHFIHNNGRREMAIQLLNIYGINRKIRNDIEGMDSRITWMSSQDQSSIGDYESVGKSPDLDQLLFGECSLSENKTTYSTQPNAQSRNHSHPHSPLSLTPSPLPSLSAPRASLPPSLTPSYLASF